MPQEKLLTEAELLGVLNTRADRTAVWRWRKQGMPYVKVGRSPRYELTAVQKWLQGHKQSNLWEWSVWSWVPSGRRPSGELEPAFWYQECRCRNQADADTIRRMFEISQPKGHFRVGQTKPEEIPK